MSAKKLVVIGGGSAGHRIAHLLQDAMQVTLVDPKTYFDVPMALPRILAQPGALPAQMAYRDFLPMVRLVQGRAVAIGRHHVDVEGSAGVARIDFDFAVVATGSRHVDPLLKAEASTVEQRLLQIGLAHEQLGRARSVAIAGGGPVGGQVETQSDRVLPADLVIWAAGTRPNTGFVATSWPV